MRQQQEKIVHPTLSKSRNFRTQVQSIRVSELFDSFSYDLKPESGMEEDSRLILLYGENGSGKTTLLKLLFHMLSFGDGRGHRSFIAQTQFKEFEVTFSDGTAFAAMRDSCDVGPYQIVVRLPDGMTQTVDVKTSKDGAVKTGDVDDHLLTKLFKKMNRHRVTPYFLSDQRTLQSDAFNQEDRQQMLIDHGLHADTALFERFFKAGATDLRGNPVSAKASIERAEAWIRKKAIHDTSTGEENTSAIYSNILAGLSGHKESNPDEDRQRLHRIIQQVRSAGEFSDAFVNVGLAPPIPMHQILNALHHADPSRISLVVEVLEPYVSSLVAKMNALEELQRLLTSFVNSLDDFFGHKKKIRVSVSEGIRIFDRRGMRLDPEMLSSGEKQLLMLFCNLMVATDRQSLFIIDEPEISLNMKWQRSILEALLSIAANGKTQFVMATHSFEILAKYKHSIAKLDNLLRFD